MTMTHISTSSGALRRQGIARRFWALGLLTLAGAVAVNTLVTLAAHALFTISPAFGPLQLASVVPATAVAVAGAGVVLALASRWSSRPVRLFRRIAAGVLLASIIPGLLLPFTGWFPGATFPAVGALLLMHVAAALLCVIMAPRLIATRA